MTRFGTLVLAFGLSAANVFTLGCMSAPSLPKITGPTPPAQQPVVVFLDPPPASVAVNAAVQVNAATTIAAVNAPSVNPAVTYSLTCGSAGNCGSLTPTNEIGAIQFTAPPSPPSGGTVALVATSVAYPTISTSATIQIVPSVSIAVTIADAPASLSVNATFSLNATVTNDVSSNPKVSWSVTCAASSCGTFQPATTGSEQSTTYTTPSAIPPGGDVTIKATSVTDPTKAAVAQIIITPAGLTLADGTYVFQTVGNVQNQPAAVTGVFVASGGLITSGEQDSIFLNTGADPYGNTGSLSQFEGIRSGSITSTADGNVLVSITGTSGTQEVLEGSLNTNQNGFISGINGAAANSSLQSQAAKPTPAGGYVIAMSPVESGDGSPWIDGVVNVDGASYISGSGSLLDVSEPNQGYQGTQTLNASSVTAPDAYGRVLFRLNPSSVGPLQFLQGPLYLAGYIVDGNHMRLIQTGVASDSFIIPTELSGVALSQGTNTGNFTAASIAEQSLAFGAEGRDVNGPLQVAGLLTFHTDGDITGSLNWNDLSAKTAQQPLASSGTYTVDPIGEVIASNVTDGSSFNYTLHFFLAGSGRGAILAADENDGFLGDAFQQASALGLSSMTGSYGINLHQVERSTTGLTGAQIIGSLTLTPTATADVVTGYADLQANDPDFSITGSFGAAAIPGVFSGSLTGISNTNGNGSAFTLYVADPTRGILLETDSNGLALGRLTQD